MMNSKYIEQAKDFLRGNMFFFEEDGARDWEYIVISHRNPSVRGTVVCAKSRIFGNFYKVYDAPHEEVVKHFRGKSNKKVQTQRLIGDLEVIINSYSLWLKDESSPTVESITDNNLLGMKRVVCRVVPFERMNGEKVLGVEKIDEERWTKEQIDANYEAINALFD